MASVKAETKAENGGNTTLVSPQGPPQQSPHQQGPGGGGRGGGGPRGRGGPNRFGGPPRNQQRPLMNNEPDMKNDNNGPRNGPPRGGGGYRGRGGRGGGGPGGEDGRNRGGPRSQDERLMEKVSALNGPTHDLPPHEPTEVKFSGHCRLYVGNLTNDVTEEEVTALFTPFGQTAELFLNKDKNFAFIRMDYRASAEKAKRELDGTMRKGRPIKVRFAPHTAAIKVKNLSPYVSNELLETAFNVFGEIERAYIMVDERGKSTGEGIVEYARKPGAQLALRKCNELCFFLTSSLRPCIVESYEEHIDTDGFPEKNMFKKNPDYSKAREVGPRFATPDSFEHDYGTRWKQLFESRKQKLEALEREMKREEEKLEAQMEYARYEHDTEILREQLRQREQDKERQKREWEMKERQHEELRLQEEEMQRRQQEEMQMRMIRQEEDMKRRQKENSLFMKAHQIENLLEQQEQALGGSGPGSGSGGGNIGGPPGGGDRGGYGGGGGGGGMDYNNGGGYGGNMRGPGGPGNMPLDPKTFMDTYDRGGNQGPPPRGGGGGGGGGYDSMDNNMGGPRGGGMGGGGGGGGRRWISGDHRTMNDNFQSKRRRY